jgi:hypothetical protein
VKFIANFCSAAMGSIIPVLSYALWNHITGAIGASLGILFLLSLVRLAIYAEDNE